MQNSLREFYGSRTTYDHEEGTRHPLEAKILLEFACRPGSTRSALCNDGGEVAPLSKAHCPVALITAP